jgi:hypothetical protein
MAEALMAKTKAGLVPPRPAPKTPAPIHTGIGFRAIRGGCVVVALNIVGGQPKMVLSSFLHTATDGDRLSLEPYSVAAELMRAKPDTALSDLEGMIADARARQNQQAFKGLAEMLDRMKMSATDRISVGLLVNRAGWITDQLSHSLSAPEHPAIAEGLAVRDALRFACDQVGLGVAELDEKTLGESAQTILDKPSSDIDATIKLLGQDAGKPWRKEQKLACLAAWMAPVMS